MGGGSGNMNIILMSHAAADEINVNDNDSCRASTTTMMIVDDRSSVSNQQYS